MVAHHRRASRWSMASLPAVALLLVCTPVHAQTQMSLSSALQVLLDNNLQIQREHERINASSARVEQAEGKRDWTLFLESGVQLTAIPTSRGDFVTENNDIDLIARGSVGVRKQFSNGVTVIPSYSVTDNLNDDSELLSELATSPNVVVVWPLLKGYGEFGASATELAARELLESTRYSADHNIAGLMHRAVTAFWVCLAAQQVLESVARTQEDVSQFVEVIKERARGGEVSAQTRRNAEVDLQLREINLQGHADRLHNARTNLTLALGIDSAKSMATAVGEFPAIGVGVIDEEALENLALENRRDLRSLEEVVASQEILFKEARNKLLPQLDITLGIDRAGLTFSKPLGNRTAKGQVGEQRAAVKQANIDHQLLARTIREQVKSALYRLHASERLYDRTMQISVLLAAVADDTRQQVAAGEKSFEAVINIQDRLTNLTIKLIDARLQHALALADIRAATGTIDVASSGSPRSLLVIFFTPPSAANR